MFQSIPIRCFASQVLGKEYGEKHRRAIFLIGGRIGMQIAVIVKSRHLVPGSGYGIGWAATWSDLSRWGIRWSLLQPCSMEPWRPWCLGVDWRDWSVQDYWKVPDFPSECSEKESFRSELGNVNGLSPKSTSFTTSKRFSSGTFFKQLFRSGNTILHAINSRIISSLNVPMRDTV